jgi:hypothetical protein
LVGHGESYRDKWLAWFDLLAANAEAWAPIVGFAHLALLHACELWQHNQKRPTFELLVSFFANSLSWIQLPAWRLIVEWYAWRVTKCS